MSEPTFKLPSGYASIKWGVPSGLTESTTMLGAAILKAFNYGNQLDRTKIEGRGGFVAGFVDMKAASNGSGGTKFDTEKLTISALHGEHASKTGSESVPSRWLAAVGRENVLTISALTNSAAGLDDWKTAAVLFRGEPKGSGFWKLEPKLTTQLKTEHQ